MTQIEILDDSESSPFQIPAGRSHHAGVPTSVSELAAKAKPWHLIGWRDSISNTIGVARNSKAIAIEIGSLDSLSICFMRQAKGTGFVSLEANARDQKNPTILFEIGHFHVQGLQWLLAKLGQLEKLFGVAVTIDDLGYDC